MAFSIPENVNKKNTVKKAFKGLIKTKIVIGAFVAGIISSSATTFAFMGVGDIVHDPTNYAQIVNQLNTLKKQFEELQKLYDEATRIKDSIGQAGSVKRQVSVTMNELGLMQNTRSIPQVKQWLNDDGSQKKNPFDSVMGSRKYYDNNLFAQVANGVIADAVTTRKNIQTRRRDELQRASVNGLAISQTIQESPQRSAEKTAKLSADARSAQDLQERITVLVDAVNNNSIEQAQTRLAIAALLHVQAAQAVNLVDPIWDRPDFEEQ